ncbi:MAG: alpha/beta hydrolase fold domain-containing protein [Phyllobacterium sp.]
MVVQREDILLDKVPGEPVSARIYRGADCRTMPPVVLYLHGGAFLDTNNHLDQPVAECLAGAGAIVVAPAYSKPTRNIFPGVLEFTFAILNCLNSKRSAFGGKKSLLFVAGEESGGNIAAGVALKARDQMPGELDGQILLSPLLDPFMGTSSFREAQTIGMRQRWADGWSQYLGSAGDMCHPYAAPCHCSRLVGVAPALVLTAQDDPLREEALGYAARLRGAGVFVHQHVLPAGSGWASIYGGRSADPPDWPQSIGTEFSRFIQEMSVCPGRN